MEGDVFDPKVKMNDVHATEGGFWINPEQAVGETATNVNMEVSVPSVTEGHDGTGAFAPVFIAVRVTISDSGPTPVQRASFSVRMAGKITISPEADKECRSEKWLRSFTVSNLYPQAQAYITILSGMAQAFGVALPTIDPVSFAELP